MKIIKRLLLSFLMIAVIVSISVLMLFENNFVFAQELNRNKTLPLSIQEFLPDTIGNIFYTSDRKKIRACTHFSMGIIYFSDYNLELALKEFKSAQTYDPNSGYIAAKIGLCLLRQGQPEEGVIQLKESIKLNPNISDPHVLLAEFYYRQNDVENAIEHYKKAIDISPDSLEIYLELGEIYINESRILDAVEVLKRALEIDPEISTLWYKIGLLYSKINNIDEAELSFRQAIKINPSFFLARLGLAIILEVGENYEGAIEQYEECIRLNPLSKNIYKRLAELYIKTDTLDKAEQIYKILIDLEPYDTYNYINLGSILLKRQQVDEALNMLLTANEKIKDTPELLFMTGLTYLGKNDLVNAFETFELARKAGGKEDLIYYYLGSVKERMGDYGEAEKLFLKSIEINPANADAYNYCAYMWAEMNSNLDKAMEFVIKALQIEPENGAYVDTLGWIYFKKGEFDKSIEQLEKASTLLNNDPVIKDHLGDAYMKIGNLEKAIQHWKKSYELDPTSDTVRGKLEKYNVLNDSEKKQEDNN